MVPWPTTCRVSASALYLALALYLDTTLPWPDGLFRRPIDSREVPAVQRHASPQPLLGTLLLRPLLARLRCDRDDAGTRPRCHDLLSNDECHDLRRCSSEMRSQGGARLLPAVRKFYHPPGTGSGSENPGAPVSTTMSQAELSGAPTMPPSRPPPRAYVVGIQRPGWHGRPIASVTRDERTTRLAAEGRAGSPLRPRIDQAVLQG